MPTNPLPRLAAQTPATVDDLPQIWNGVYAIEMGYERYMYRISTITSARTHALVGKRVISRMGDRSWEMFAFLTQAGTVKVWQRFASDLGEPSIYAAEKLMGAVDRASIGQGHRYSQRSAASFRDASTDSIVEFTIKCRVCNGTVPVEDFPSGLCAVHQAIAVRGVVRQSATTTTFSTGTPTTGTFQVAAEVVYDSASDSIRQPVVPAAILQRLARSEIDSRNIR